MKLSAGSYPSCQRQLGERKARVPPFVEGKSALLKRPAPPADRSLREEHTCTGRGL